MAFLAYTLLSFILLLRNDWAVQTIASFYPQIGQTLFNLKDTALKLHLNTVPTALYFLIVLSAFYCYWRIVTGKWIKNQQCGKILLCSIVFQGILVASYPALSTDVFDYILQNRVAFTYQQNPWITPPIAFPADPFINLGHWQRISSVYGPVHHVLALFPEIVGGDDLIRSVLGFKFLMVIFTYLTARFLIMLIPEKDKARHLALFMFNPLVLIETAGNAHNDIIMVAFMVASLVALRRNRFPIAGILIGLGAMVKLYAVALIPLYLAFLARKGKWVSALGLLVSSFCTVLFGIWFMGINSLQNQIRLFGWVFTLRLNSLPNLLNMLPDWVFLLPFLVFALYKLSAIDDKTKIVRTYVILTLVYLLFVVELYWAWYPIWYIPFLSLLRLTRIVKAALTFAMTSSLHYAILFLSHRFSYQHILWTVAIYLFLIVPPIIVYLKAKNG